MTATLIPTSSETEWLAARRAGITASEIAVVMGLSPYSSPYALYHQKLGALPGQDETDAMRLGKHMESFVADRFSERHPEFGLGGDGQTLWAHLDRPWQMATPDRIVFEAARLSGPNLAVLECKVDGGSDDWGDDGTDEIPVHYRCQLLWQMDVMDVTTGYLACLLWHRRQVRVYEITMDEAAQADLKLMRYEAQAFLDRIQWKRAPEVDWRPATRDALNRLHPDLDDIDVPIGRQMEISYRAAVRRAAEADRRKDEMTNQVLAAIGNGRRATGRAAQPVATRSVSTQRRVSATLVRERHPAVAAECTVTSTVTKLTPAKPKKEKTS